MTRIREAVGGVMHHTDQCRADHLTLCTSLGAGSRGLGLPPSVPDCSDSHQTLMLFENPAWFATAACDYELTLTTVSHEAPHLLVAEDIGAGARSLKVTGTS